MRKVSATQMLRNECKLRGIKYTAGLFAGDKKINEDNITTLWDETDSDKGLTFEESEHGSLYCVDALEVDEAIAAYLAGREKAWREVLAEVKESK